MSNKRIKADIIDNIRNGITMQKILNSEIPYVKHLDISTGYFNVEGYAMVQKKLDEATKNESFVMRLLLGKEAILSPEGSFEKYAQKYEQSESNVTNELSVKTSLDKSDFTLETQTDTTNLIKLLEQKNIHVRLGTRKFNHSKCYIFDDNSVYIGSSNFTHGGLTGNYELNAGLYQPNVAAQTREWFDRMWNNANDTKADLINVLKQSKFGIPPEPYEVYMKILFERYKPFLAKIDSSVKGGIPLPKFQQDAIHTGLFIVSAFNGVIIADATGLGKTNMGIEIIRQKILHEGKKVLLIAPAQVLHSMWEEKLKDVDIHVREILTTESLGREEILHNLGKYRNIDLVLIDESQNFRSSNAKRRKHLMKLMSVGKRKQSVLLSATPINNSLMDLYYQLSIITGGDDYYFYKTIGIQNLYTHMKDAAHEEGLQQGLEKIQQLLDNVMVRRTRSYIKEVYKEDRINNKKIEFPMHKYKPIHYSLSDLFGNIFEKILHDINSLKMAPYGIERYNKNIDQAERDKHKVLAHLQVILLLKRFESSIAAVKISLDNKIQLYEYVRKILEQGEILRVKDFNNLIIKWNSIDDNETDEKEKENFFMKEIHNIKKEKATTEYNIVQLKADMDSDLIILHELYDEVDKITVDTKLDQVIHTILKDDALKKDGKKVLIFTEYTATARYITKVMKEKFTNKTVLSITGNTRVDTRKQYIKRFAPESNLPDGEILEHKEIDILISTEVLAEGQNLQDCNYVINYDLPWNPMRIVQRIGRVDRLTSKYDVIYSRACYPDDALDKILMLVGKLMSKINSANKTIGLDTELLGEMPTPRQFNGTALQRIKVLAGDNPSEQVIQDLEHESDIMPPTSPMNELSRYIKDKGIDVMKDVPMGRRSGKKGDEQKTVLLYLQVNNERRVYFVIHDHKNDTTVVVDDESDAMRIASCVADEPKYLPMDSLDNHESFELLLKIDKKARIAIVDHNNKVLEYVKNIKKESKNKLEKNITVIKQIVTDNTINGNINEQDGETVMDVIKSLYIKAWENEINNALEEYIRNNEINTLISSIKHIGEFVGDEYKQDIVETNDAFQKTSLTLVGALFIVGEKYDTSLNKKY